MEKIMSKDEAAELLDISVHTLNKEIERGAISFRLVSKTPKFTRADLEEYLERQKQEAKAA